MDGRGRVFVDDTVAAVGQLKRTSISGGVPVSLAEIREPFGVSWGSNDVIVYGDGESHELWQVSANGGTPQRLTALNREAGEVSHRLPNVLPGGGAVLFTVRHERMGGWDKAQVVVQSLATGEQKVLVDGGADARYLPTGHVAFARMGTLMAAPFDLGRLEVTGESVSIVDGVAQAVNAENTLNDTGAAQFAVSDSGTLAYLAGDIFPDHAITLVWVDRQGVAERLAAPVRGYYRPRLSKDGQRVLLWTQGLDRIVWIYDISRGTLQRLTFEGQSSRPIWSPDEQWVVYSSTGTAGAWNLFRRRADGSGAVEQLTTSEEGQQAYSWSPDGQHVAFWSRDIWVLELDTGQAQPFVQTSAREAYPAFSPDGRWLAFTSDESGREEVYVQPFPGPGPKVPISSEGGIYPVWGKTGQELFYRSGDAMVVAQITTEPQFAGRRPEVLFEAPDLEPTHYDVTQDGQRFLMLQQIRQEPVSPPTQLDVVLNWFEELKERVPVD